MNGCFHLNGNDKKKLQIFAADYIFLKLFSSSEQVSFIEVFIGRGVIDVEG